MGEDRKLRDQLKLFTKGEIKSGSEQEVEGRKQEELKFVMKLTCLDELEGDDKEEIVKDDS